MKTKLLICAVIGAFAATAAMAGPFVQVNHALSGTASEIGVDFNGVPERAIDNNTDGNWGSSSTTHTTGSTNPWWEVDLGASKKISLVRFWKRTDCCADQGADVKISILAADRSVVETFTHDGPAADLYFDFVPPVGTAGRIVRAERMAAGNIVITIAELQVFECRDDVAVNATLADANAVQSRTATFTPVAEVVNASAKQLHYQWKKGPDDIAGATGKTLTTGNLALADDGATYTVNYLLPDCDGNDLVVGSASAKVHVSADQTAPTILSLAFAGAGATASSSLLATVSFDELLDPASAIATGNYNFGAGKTVTDPTLNADGKSVTLKVSGLAQNAAYSLTVTGVKDLALNPVASTTLPGTVPFFEINVALLGGTATQSSTAYNGVPERAIDGNVDGQWGSSSTTHTSDAGGGELNPFWEDDLGADRTIGRLVYWPRTDCCAVTAPLRNRNVRMSILNAARDVVWTGTFSRDSLDPTGLNVGDNNNSFVVGSIIRVERELTAKDVLSIAELQAIAPYQNV